jgi:tripartite-type tricarboxylate transporter receptor subunit TctC
MKATRRTALALTCAAAALGPWALVGSAQAQAWPGNQVVKLVVPFPPAGVVDIVGRMLADRLQPALPGTVIVENRVGAGGTVGAQHVARASSDGLTLLMGGAATHAFAPSMFKQLKYDPVKDFVAVSQVSSGPLVLVVNAASPIKTFDDFMRAVGAAGTTMNYASNGVGTYPHLAVELLKQQTGLKTTHVPYKGGGQAAVAVLADEVNFSLNHVPVVLAQIKAGKMRALATTGTARSPLFPDLPTLKEAGIDVVAEPWFGVFAPAGTPQAIVQKLADGVAAAMGSDDIKQKLASLGDQVKVQGPKAFADFQAAELDKWGKVINAAGISAQ